MQRSLANQFYSWALLGFVLVSCKSTTTPELETLTLDVSVSVDVAKPTKFTATLAVTNRAATDTTYSAYCSSELRVYSIADSAGTPIWTSSSGGLECGGISRITVHAGQTVTEGLTASAQEVLGASKPDAEYRIEVVAFLAGKKRILNAGRVTLLK